jgi:hypothetical protein
MHDDVSAHDGRDDANRARAQQTPEAETVRRSGRARDTARLSDREVPIELTRTPDLVHAWLDGELPESGVRGAEAVRHVEFWKRVDRDLEVRRQAHAPVDLTERIMEALPTTAPRAVAPWWNRRMEMNPVAAAAAATGLLALGAAIGASMRVLR